MAKKKSARTSLRPIVTEIDKVQEALFFREKSATPPEVRRLKARIRRLRRLSALTRGMCRGFFI